MNDTTLIELAPTAPRPNLLGAAAKQLVLGRLAALECGTLRVHDVFNDSQNSPSLVAPSPTERYVTSSG